MNVYVTALSQAVLKWTGRLSVSAKRVFKNLPPIKIWGVNENPHLALGCSESSRAAIQIKDLE